MRALDQDRTFTRVKQLAKLRGLSDPRNGARVLETAGQRHGDEIDARMSVARLHAGLAVVRVVEHDDGEIFRLLDADGGEAAHAHQHVAIAGQHGDAAIGLRQSEPEADHRGAAHRAPQIEVERMIAGRGDVIGRRAQPADDEQIAAVDQQLPYEVAPVEHHRVHCLRPISRCDSRIATWRLPSNAMSQPAPTISSTASASSTR